MLKTLQKRNKGGFTIVELLVVIVVIGILAAITIVSYSGITARANAAAGKNEAGAAISKIIAYNTETTYNEPSSWGSLTGAPLTSTYNANSLNFTTTSGNKDMTVFRQAGIANDAVDFFACGTTGSATAVGSYGGTNPMTVFSGVQMGYWDYTLSTPTENYTTVHGTVSGMYNSNQPVTCWKIGLAEAVIAVARAMYTETGSYPISAAVGATSFMGSTAKTALLPAGVTVIRTGTVNLNAGNGTNTVYVECGTAVNLTPPCLPNGAGSGGRIYYWDYNTGAVTATPIIYGSATTNFAAPAT
jgi:prepilin-type N-terminal cleavage/methylation domain-containing protein